MATALAEPTPKTVAAGRPAAPGHTARPGRRGNLNLGAAPRHSRFSLAVRWLAVAAAFTTYLLIVVGGVVRVTGSGLGCGNDWPRCNGQLVPAMETVAQAIEYTHRIAAAAASGLIVTVVVAAWAWRPARRIVLPATATLVCLVLQIALGAVVVRTDLQPFLVMAHLGVAMLVLGGTVVCAASLAEPVGNAGPAPRPHYRTLLAAMVVAVYLLILLGAYTRATGASWACAGFPGCAVPAAAVAALETESRPPFSLVQIHLAHRYVAYLASVLVAASAAETWRLHRRRPAMLWAAGLLLAAMVVQVAVGAFGVNWGLPSVLRGAHVAGAAAVWGFAVLLLALEFPSPFVVVPLNTGTMSLGERGRAASRVSPAAKVRAYVTLTKPKVILLLEVPTLAAMLVAQRALPSPALVLATMVGGALAAGGAAAINSYLDRDIDALMGSRTQRRPIPAGVVSPGQALAYGLALAVASFVILVAFANVLAAFLAQAALLVYVFIYTRWLKRSTPSNIVIGGAAGAIPPLVGWAAVTGEVGPLAWLLFAIIFFWTPPHFWALSLLIKQHYARANVPMLPVVRGEAETRRQIIYYTVQMIAVTVLLFALRLSGLFYLAAALMLGAIFLYLAVQLWREATARAASRLFHYSMLYLWLLCLALVLDKRLFT